MSTKTRRDIRYKCVVCWCVCVCLKQEGLQKEDRDLATQQVLGHVTFLNESCHVYEWGHVMYEWVMTQLKEDCDLATQQVLSHVTYERVMWYINESCLALMSHVMHEWVMALIWMSRVSHEWVMSHINGSCHAWMSHESTERRLWSHYTNQVLRHVTYEWVMALIWMSHVSHEWVMSHINESMHACVMGHQKEDCDLATQQVLSHVTYKWVMSRMNESCHVWMSHVTYEWVMSRMNES